MVFVTTVLLSNLSVEFKTLNCSQKAEGCGKVLDFAGTALVAVRIFCIRIRAGSCMAGSTCRHYEPNSVMKEKFLLLHQISNQVTGDVLCLNSVEYDVVNVAFYRF